MPPKDHLFSGKPCEIFFAPYDENNALTPLGEVIADSLSYEAGNEPTEAITAPTTGKYEFSIDNMQIDNETITKLFENEPVRKDRAFSVIIQMGEEYIYRPKNLKYPNKKRAKRIWKKWRRRYGAYYPEQVVLPNCTLTTEAQGNDFHTQITPQ